MMEVVDHGMPFGLGIAAGHCGSIAFFELEFPLQNDRVLNRVLDSHLNVPGNPPPQPGQPMWRLACPLLRQSRTAASKVRTTIGVLIQEQASAQPDCSNRQQERQKPTGCNSRRSVGIPGIPCVDWWY